MTAVRMTIGPWTARWNGGRLADVYHAEATEALDCFQVGDFDWTTGEAKNATTKELRAALEEWIRDNGAAFTREIPYLR